MTSETRLLSRLSTIFLVLGCVGVVLAIVRTDLRAPALLLGITTVVGSGVLRVLAGILSEPRRR